MSGVQLGYETLLISFSSAQIHKCMLFLNARKKKLGHLGFLLIPILIQINQVYFLNERNSLLALD